MSTLQKMLDHRRGQTKQTEVKPAVKVELNLAELTDEETIAEVEPVASVKPKKKAK